MSAEARQEQEIEAKLVSMPTHGASAQRSADSTEPAQEFRAYKKHSLAAGYWGDIQQSEQPLRSVGAEEAQV